jgi:cell division protein FtsW
MAALAVRRRAPRGRPFGGLDPVLLASTGVLVCIGILMVYSASFVFAQDTYHDGLYFLKRQAVFAVVGGLLLLGLARVRFQFWDKVAWPLAVLSYASLLALFVPGLGVTVGGARRWLALPFFRVEPSEFAKLALIVLLAHCLAARGERIKDFKHGLLPLLGMVAAFMAVIIKEPDLGTCITIGVVALVMLFLGGARKKHMAAIGAAVAPLLVVAVMCADYRMRRVLAFLSPWDDPLGNGFQIIHSFLAFGSGGVLGQGAGAGLQKLWYLPQSHTDFIFSVLAEELGLVGVVFVVAVFATFIIRGLMVSARAEDTFGYYLGVGLTLMIGLQAIINICVVMGLLPTKGLTLPFISYGGTSLALNLVAVGMLLNVAAQSRRA